MSAKALPLVLFPLAVMIVGILFNFSAVAGSSNQTGVGTGNAAGNAVFCANPQQTNCIVAGSSGTSYYCNPSNIIGYLQACKILPSCGAPPYPSPAFCIGDILDAFGAGCGFQFLTSGAAGCGVYLPAGFSVFLATSQIASSLTAQGAFFGFSGGFASGFIAVIGIAVGIISLLGLTVFGTGEQGEGLHILFEGGMVMGMWLIITAIEGFPGSSTEQMFNGLNAALNGAGTFIYAILTLSVVAGFLGLVSRGA